MQSLSSHFRAQICRGWQEWAVLSKGRVSIESCLIEHPSFPVWLSSVLSVVHSTAPAVTKYTADTQSWSSLAGRSPVSDVVEKDVILSGVCDCLLQALGECYDPLCQISLLLCVARLLELGGLVLHTEIREDELCILSHTA